MTSTITVEILNDEFSSSEIYVCVKPMQVLMLMLGKEHVASYCGK